MSSYFRGLSWVSALVGTITSHADCDTHRMFRARVVENNGEPRHLGAQLVRMMRVAGPERCFEVLLRHDWAYLNALESAPLIPQGELQVEPGFGCYYRESGPHVTEQFPVTDPALPQCRQYLYLHDPVDEELVLRIYEATNGHYSQIGALTAEEVIEEDPLPYLEKAERKGRGNDRS